MTRPVFQSLVLIAHNLRSSHNVGSLLRTADGLGIEKVYLTGYTPYPVTTDDARLPHIAEKVTKQIHKTALGAEHTVAWEHTAELSTVFAALRETGYQITALEQTPTSVPLVRFKAAPKVALVVGREVEGIELEILELCDQLIEIPMRGAKESFNVSIAAAMALYHMTYLQAQA